MLVSAASKYGATSEIAEEIGKTLREALRDRDVGVDDVVVEVRPAEEVSSVDDYSAVVPGTAVYAGHWLEGARDWPSVMQRSSDRTEANRTEYMREVKSRFGVNRQNFLTG